MTFLHVIQPFVKIVYFSPGPTVLLYETRHKKTGLEVIKLESILRLKIKRNDWLLTTRVRKQPIIALYFESENGLQFYNLEARYSGFASG